MGAALAGITVGRIGEGLGRVGKANEGLSFGCSAVHRRHPRSQAGGVRLPVENIGVELRDELGVVEFAIFALEFCGIDKVGSD